MPHTVFNAGDTLNDALISEFENPTVIHPTFFLCGPRPAPTSLADAFICEFN